VNKYSYFTSYQYFVAFVPYTYTCHILKKIAGHVSESSSNIMASYRSSFQNFRDGNPSTSNNLRTLFAFRLPSFSLPKPRFLRVLHVEDSYLTNFGRTISGCIHLRYISRVEKVFSGYGGAPFFNWTTNLLANYRPERNEI
jgi:hypothetical protein